MADSTSFDPPGSDLAPTIPSGSGVSDLVGTVLAGRYRILKKLGDGGMGAVYLGEHLKFGRKDAIKVLHPSLATDPEAIARFNRGARNVSAIRHPNICTIYDCSDTEEGFQFLAMEFIPGETLKELMDRERVLPLERALRIAKQVTDALGAAHDAGIVHRDLKPANIMILPGRDGADEVRVVDFDIAKGSLDEDTSEVTRIGYVVGTPEYMSPEQLTAERLDGRSDLYSLGLILFRMLTDAFPFRAETREDLFLGRLTQTPRRLDEVVPGGHFPPELQAILDGALQRSPAERYPHAAAFGRDISEVLQRQHATSPAAVLPPTPADGRERSGTVPETRISESHAPHAPAPAHGTGRRSKLLTVAFSLLALAILGGGAVWAVARMGSEDAQQEQTAAMPPISQPVPPISTPPGMASGTQGSGTLGQVGQPAAAVAELPPIDAPGSATPPRPAATVPPGSPGGRANTPMVARPAPAVSSPAPSSAPAASREDPSQILRRQLGRVASADPQSAVLTATRDTAEMIWRQDGAPSDKARAAYIVAQVWAARGERDQCATWAQRAVNLNDSNQGYQRLLNTCKGETP